MIFVLFFQVLFVCLSAAKGTFVEEFAGDLGSKTVVILDDTSNLKCLKQQLWTTGTGYYILLIVFFSFLFSFFFVCVFCFLLLFLDNMLIL